MAPTVGTLMREWQARRAPVCTARTRATNVAPVNVICEQMGWMQPAEIKSSNVEMFRNSLLARGMSKLTAARYLSTLRAGLGDAGEHLKIGKLISELKREPVRVECWSKREAESILSVANMNSVPRSGGFYTFVKFLFATGCRRGEALSLHAEDIDFSKYRLHIHRSLTLDGSLQNGTKWGGERLVPLAASLSDILKVHLGPIDSGSVFPALDQRNVGRRFKQLCKVAKVPQHKMHCTRHSAISWALAGGVSLRKASEIFGVSQSTLEKHYAHYVEEKVDMSWAEL
jgi:integrase